MNHLTNEEISRVLNIYAGCRCKYNIGFDQYSDSIFLAALPNNIFYHQPYNNQIVPGITKLDTFNKYGIQLSLCLLSSIKNEDAVELARLTYGDQKNMSWVEIGKGIISDYLNRGFELKPVEYVFLIEKGYAVPLWAKGCNGKTAIELGIAIEKTV